MSTRWWCAAVVLAASSAGASGQVSYRYEAASASVSFVPGGGTVVDVFLRETRLGAGAGLAERGGLFGAGFSVSHVGGGTLPIIGISGNPALFGGPTSGSVTATAASFLQAVDLETLAGVMPDAEGRIWVGRVTLGPTAAALPVVFALGRRDELGGNTIAFDGTDLDFDGPGVVGATGSGLVMVYATIPEPGWAGLWLGLGAWGLVRRRG